MRKGKWAESNLILFNVKGDENANNIFEFFGDNFTRENGIPLEWSKVQIGTNTNGTNIIGTSMKDDATGVGHYILFHGYTIRGVDHNHTGGADPSDADIDNAKIYHLKFPKAVLRVFFQGKYFPYDNNTPKSTGIFLREIEVIGKR